MPTDCKGAVASAGLRYLPFIFQHELKRQTAGLLFFWGGGEKRVDSVLTKYKKPNGFKQQMEAVDSCFKFLIEYYDELQGGGGISPTVTASFF